MDSRVATVLRLITEDPRNGLRLAVLARVVKLSPSRLRHVFKAEVGVTPAQYARKMRLERARELLDTTLLSVKEVSAILGIKDQSQFTKDFKAMFGMAPREYKKSRGLKNQELEKRAGRVFIARNP